MARDGITLYEKRLGIKVLKWKVHDNTETSHTFYPMIAPPYCKFKQDR